MNKIIIDNPSGALEELGKVGSRIPSIREGLYLGDGIVDTFKDKI